MKKFKVGITGGIGSGKSTVCRFFQEWHVTIIDADAISHELTQAGGKAIPAIRAAFGDISITPEGAMNRVYMRELAFKDVSARKKLQDIIHPAIKEETALRTAQAEGVYIMYDIPLLVESINKYRDFLDVVCVVDCEESEQVLRVKNRSGLDTDAIMDIIRAQASREQRLAVANEVIFNGRGVNQGQLRQRAHELHQKWLLLAQQPA